MYHIVNDKRAYASSRLVRDALFELVKEKPYDKITISDICRESTVSRATFYRLFDNMDDVVAWQVELFSQHFEKVVANEPNVRTMEIFFEQWMIHDDILDLIIEIHREDILYTAHQRHAVQLEKRLQLDGEFSNYHAAALSMLMIAMLTTWAKNGKKESAKELVATYRRVLRDCAKALTE